MSVFVERAAVYVLHFVLFFRSFVRSFRFMPHHTHTLD